MYFQKRTYQNKDSKIRDTKQKTQSLVLIHNIKNQAP